MTTILLVEDNPDLRAATGDLLKSLGYHVCVAAGVGAALDMAGSTPFDLLVVNAYPARGEGLEIVDRVRGLIPELPALLVSGYGDDIPLRQRVLAGNVAFLSIPFSSDALQRKVGEVLQQRPAPVPASVTGDVQSPAGTSFKQRARWLAAAAVGVFAVGLVFQLMGGAPDLPAPDEGGARRGVSIELVEPVGEVDRIPTRFAWRETPGAASYRVVLRAVDDSLLWEEQTRATSVQLPPEVADKLHPAVSYSWQVEALGDDLSKTATSAPAIFYSRPQAREASASTGNHVNEGVQA